MTSWVIAVGISLVAFVIMVLLMPKSRAASSVDRRQEMLSELERSRADMQGSHGSALQQHDYTLADAMDDLSPTGQALVRLPYAIHFYRLILQAGLKEHAGTVTAVASVLALLACVVGIKLFGVIGVFPALGGSFFAVRAYLKHRIAKRNRAFMDRFADGIDMIVRAIRSGNPLNSALRLVAEHGESPVKDEFRLVVDEVTYGRPLIDALARMAKRVPEYDVSFFVVVLTVQQETGGNLGEVLGKLSFIIRKRQELFLKVRAITAEGRATAWILGLLPIALLGVLTAMSYDYIKVLFFAPGIYILCAAIFMIGLGVFIIRKMAQIEV